MHLYHDNRQRLPPNRRTLAESPSWAWLILPYLEQSNLYKLWPEGWSYPGIDPTKPITLAGKQIAGNVLSTKVALYFCPSFRAPGDPSTLSSPFKQDIQ
jgi:hypothetical protein